jgi:hypothetical protein
MLNYGGVGGGTFGGAGTVFAGTSAITGGTVLVDNGTVTSPSLGFTTENDGTGTGFYLQGASSIGVTLNGTGGWRWGSTGTFLPITNNTVDIGIASIAPRDGYFARTLQVGNAVAVTAGGAATGFIGISSTANLGVFCGSGVPTISAAQGSLYIRTDGSTTSTRLYVNTNGTTGWTAVTTAT